MSRLSRQECAQPHWAANLRKRRPAHRRLRALRGKWEGGPRRPHRRLAAERPVHRVEVRQARHGFWDEEFAGRVDSFPHPSAEDEYFAEPQPEPPCTHDELYAAIRQLTTRQAFVTRLFFGLDCEPLSIMAIAELLGWHHSTVQEHLELAEKKLRRLLPRDGAY